MLLVRLSCASYNCCAVSLYGTLLIALSPSNYSPLRVRAIAILVKMSLLCSILWGSLEELTFYINKLIQFDHFRRCAGEYYPCVCSHFDCDTIFISKRDFSKIRSKIRVKESCGFNSHFYVTHTGSRHCLPIYKTVARDNETYSYWLKFLCERCLFKNKNKQTKRIL